MQNFNKVLIIRFSSFGDVTQCLSVPSAIKNKYPQCQIHWVTRQEFLPLIETHPSVNCVWTLKKRDGFTGLLKLIQSLKKENYSHIYDAHNNLRSTLICFYLSLNLRFLFNTLGSIINLCKPYIIRRSIRRIKRFLLFSFRLNLFQQPFSGQRDLLEPLKAWDIPSTLPPTPQIFFKPENIIKLKKVLEETFKESNPTFYALAPSSAHELKKWPQDYWIKLIESRPQDKFVLLGGPEDLFLQKIQAPFPERVFNFAGAFNLSESGIIISLSKMLIANDTGLLHIAEQLGHPCIALMGPAPFGFPSRRESTLILERNLKCRPCSKHGQGPCVNKIFQECLRDIKPEEVSQSVMNFPFTKEHSKLKL